MRTLICNSCGKPTDQHLCGGAKRQPGQAELDALAKAYLGGQSIAEIAKQAGSSYGAVRRRLLLAGVTLRAPGRIKGVSPRVRPR